MVDLFSLLLILLGVVVTFYCGVLLGIHSTKKEYAIPHGVSPEEYIACVIYEPFEEKFCGDLEEDDI